MGKRKVVLDTNILISALGWKGKPRQIFRKILDGKFDLVISHNQLYELLRVMNYPNFNFKQEQKVLFLTIIIEVATVIETVGNLRVIEDDHDDNVILESAIVGNVDFIISGDEHLLKLKKYEKVMIVTAAEFLNLVD